MSFEKIGEKSRKDYALEVLRSHTVGQVVTYDALSEAVGSGDRAVIQAAARDAAKDFLKFDKHAIEAVPNEGYRIVTADEHVRLAEKQRKRSVRTIRKGQHLVSRVDFNTMTPEARKLAEVMELGFAHMLEAERRISARQDAQERVTEATVKRQDRTEEEVAELKARLARLEGRA